MKTLIIDDEVDICYLLSSILRNKGISAQYVNSLAEANKCLQNEKPDIIFLDNHLPDGMGMDYISYIKEYRPTAKIIMISAYDTSTDRSKAIQLGADQFIAKPFTIENIYNAVERLA